jgi:hypothetical protein
MFSKQLDGRTNVGRQSSDFSRYDVGWRDGVTFQELDELMTRDAVRNALSDGGSEVHQVDELVSSLNVPVQDCFFKHCLEASLFIDTYLLARRRRGRLNCMLGRLTDQV